MAFSPDRTSSSMVVAFVSTLLFSIVTSQQDTRCEERLDVISTSAWSALPQSYFGLNLSADAKSFVVGDAAQGTHALLHTINEETFLRGSSESFHLYGGDMTRELVEMRGKRVKDAQFGANFLAILTEDGKIWMAGDNTYGQLGRPSPSADVNIDPVFKEVESLESVEEIAVGQDHCVARLADGALYSWGRNNHAQLGYNTTSEVNPVPTLFNLGSGVPPPEHVCCGCCQCTAKTINGGLYTWGKASAIGRQGDATHPDAIDGIPDGEGNSVRQVTCGKYHTLARTDSGHLYGWGTSNFGELLDVASDANQASPLDLGLRVVRDVVAGDRLTIIRTYSSVSEYFGWYDGESVRTPRLATELGHARDVMAKGISDQETWGIVKPDCLTGHPQQ